MTLWLWVGFVAFILLMLWLDLAVINRRAHVVRAREAIAWTGVCVALALAFNVLVYFMYQHHCLGIGGEPGEGLSGREAAEQFFAGWLIEYSLSLDNILVMAVIFRHFRVPAQHQHRLLFWGVLGALVMRGAMILAGAALISRFWWTEYVFGGILLWTAIRMFLAGDQDPEPERGWVLRAARRVLPISASFCGERFVVTENGRRLFTPLFLVLLVVETTDVIFAVDSIPAVFGITRDPFLVFTSNVFAILGLRSLYFALAAMIGYFRHVKTSLVLVLGFVGVKMILGHAYPITTGVSLAVVGGLLGLGLAASLLLPAAPDSWRQAPIEDLALAAEAAWTRARRVVILVIGLTIIFIFAPLTAPIPGPGGFAVALAGLALLATEFVWARRLLQQLKAQAAALAQRAESALVGERPRLWPVPVVLLLFAGLIAALIWWEPKWTVLILMGAAGPAIAVGYWSATTVIRWRRVMSGKKNRGGPEWPPAGGGGKRILP
jgi:TerC family integral membrane protein